MVSASRPFRLRLSLAVAALYLAGSGSSADAQSYDCDRLRQAIYAAGRPDSQRTAQFAQAAQRQRVELARTQAYADQIGCSHGFSIFGNDGPPQCDTIATQIDRMTSNLNALQQQIAQFQTGDPNRQAALTDQYRASCSSEASTDPAPPDTTSDDPLRQGLDDVDPDQPGNDAPRRYGKAICVRTCDGGFFPLSFSPADRSTQGLQNLCSALCPNTEAKLYTTPDLDNIGAAVAVDGASYSQLPAAFKYQKSFDAACTCKPAEKSWVQALADAEQLLGKPAGKDVTVTTKMSDDMARPVAAAPGGPAQPKRKFNKTDIKALLDAQKAAEGALGAVGAQAPTATTESAGIAGDARPVDQTVKTGVGAVKTQAGPNGARRQVRIVGPAL